MFKESQRYIFTPRFAPDNMLWPGTFGDSSYINAIDFIGIPHEWNIVEALNG